MSRLRICGLCEARALDEENYCVACQTDHNKIKICNECGEVLFNANIEETMVAVQEAMDDGKLSTVCENCGHENIFELDEEDYI